MQVVSSLTEFSQWRFFFLLTCTRREWEQFFTSSSLSLHIKNEGSGRGQSHIQVFFRSFVPWTHHAILYCCCVRSQMFYEKKSSPLHLNTKKKNPVPLLFFCSDIYKVRALYHSLLLWRICISRSSWAWRERKKKKNWIDSRRLADILCDAYSSFFFLLSQLGLSLLVHAHV